MKKINVTIGAEGSDKDLESLKKNGYILCIAKQGD